MRFLSVDAAGKGLSLAVVDYDLVGGLRVLAYGGINAGLTHSQRLLPLLDSLMSGAGVELGSLEAVAVVNGPGSFTGLRIGLATAKGLAWGLGLPVAAISTLEAAAYNAYAPGLGEDTLLCPVLDARRGEVYCALYKAGEAGQTGIEELWPAMALAPGELAGRLAEVLAGENRPGAYRRVILAGDACELIYEEMREQLAGRVLLAAPERRFFNAAGCAMAAGRLLAAGKGKPPAEVGAFYLRASEAERNRLAKLAAAQGEAEKK